MKLGRAPATIMILSTFRFWKIEYVLKLLVSSSLSLETNGHDLRGIGDVGLSVNAARFRDELHDVSGRMFLVLAKGFDHCPDIATTQTMFWKINQQRD